MCPEKRGLHTKDDGGGFVWMLRDSETGHTTRLKCVGVSSVASDKPASRHTQVRCLADAEKVAHFVPSVGSRRAGHNHQARCDNLSRFRQLAS
jgi:hypothetical protein